MIPLLISSTNKKNAERLEALSGKMSQFYNQVSEQGYWETAENFNLDWKDGSHPFHERLLACIKKDDELLDIGCGSAHILHHLPEGAKYTGIDISKDQVNVNTKRYPQHQFINEDIVNGKPLSRQYDLTISLYALEHCVYPARLLDAMILHTKLNGRVAIICPSFRPYSMNSFNPGLTAKQSIRNKIKEAKYLDASVHMLEQFIIYPIYLKMYSMLGGSFLVYENPKCLKEEYNSDTDAVYWSSLREVRSYFTKRGFEIEEDTSTHKLAGTKATLFLIAKKLREVED